MNQYINLTLENIEKEHICCAIGDKKHQAGVTQKKEWIYADEADMLNIIIFGCTAKQWREANMDKYMKGENIKRWTCI